jgi:RNA processing factor Prp31
MLTESDLLEYLSSGDVSPAGLDTNDPQTAEQKRLAESRKATILLMLRNEHWDDLTAIINMHREKLKDLSGLDFLAFMLNVLPHRIYILLVRLFNIESELQKYKISHIARIKYEEVVIDV